MRKRSKSIYRDIFFAKFRLVLALLTSFIFAKKCEILLKSLRNAIEKFRFFPETFRSLETLLRMQRLLSISEHIFLQTIEIILDS